MMTLYKTLGGSHLYGLETPSSDTDVRGVYLNTDPSFILGLNRFDQQITQDPSKGEDIVWRELRHFFCLLKKANTECLELLFNDKKPIEEHFWWSGVKNIKHHLIDTDFLFKTLREYISGEKNLIFGKSTGKLGEKRKNAIEKYGYSNRNLVHFLRLCFVGEEVFQTGIYPVDLSEYYIHNLLMEIKTKPETFNKNDIDFLVREGEIKLKDSYDNRKYNSVFDENVANSLLMEFYMEFLTEKKISYTISTANAHNTI